MAKWRVAQREEQLIWGSIVIFFCALLFSLALSAILLNIQDKNGLSGVLLLLEGGFGHLYSWEDTILKAIPIFLCSLGVAFCFRLQIWNIGAEGQYILGALGGSWFVLTFPSLPVWLMIPGMFFCAAFAGAIWAGFAALFRQRWHMNEIITTLMLNYIAWYLLDFVVFGPLRDPLKGGHPVSPDFPAAAIIPSFFGRIHWGFALCIILSIGTVFFIKKTRPGFELKAAGSNSQAARYAGMPYNLLIFMCMGICGAMAGSAGILEASSSIQHLESSIAAGYGFTAVIVAWLANLSTLRIAFFSIILAGVKVGVENLQIDLGVSKSFATVMDGLILLSVLAGQFFVNYRLRIRTAQKIYLDMDPVDLTAEGIEIESSKTKAGA